MPMLRPAVEMKDSGIECVGRIPKEWTTRKIKYGFTVISGATPKSDVAEYWDGDITWVTPADYKTEDIYVGHGRKKLTQLGYDSCGTTIVPTGSLIFSKRAPIGTVAINSVPLCTNQGCLSCVPNRSVMSKYYYYVMSVFTEQFEVYGSGTLFKEISAQNFANIDLPYPDLNEQQAIADYLDDRCSKIDEIIAEATASIEEYKELKQAVIFEAVTKGLDKTVPMKDSGVEWIGEIPANWKLTILRRYCSFQTGKTPSTSVPEWFDGDVNWFTPSDFNDSYYLVDSRRKLSEKAMNDSAAISVPENCVMIVGIGGSAGKVGITGVSCSCNQQITAVLSSEIYSKYLMYFLELSGKYLKETAMFTTLPILNNDTLGNSPLIVPTIGEQRLIADYLDVKLSAITALIEEKQVLIEDMHYYKKSLIYELVTGKKRVIS